MRSLRPIVISSSHKATENQSDMMRMKQNDDSLGRDTILCGDPSFLSLMKGTQFFNEYNMDVEVTSSIFPQPSSILPLTSYRGGVYLSHNNQDSKMVAISS